MKLHIETASRPRIGEMENGDGTIHRQGGDLCLWAVIDGLGHGAGAAQTTNAALSYLKAAPLTTDVIGLIEGVRLVLKGTRGAVALLAVQQNNQLFGCGVGNISFRGSRAALSILSVPGILGGKTPSPKLFRCALQPGDRLALFSDGISGKFSWEELRNKPARDAAQYILARHGRGHDDATISIADVTE